VTRQIAAKPKHMAKLKEAIENMDLFAIDAAGGRTRTSKRINRVGHNLTYCQPFCRRDIAKCGNIATFEALNMLN
jgi:hypothetical protein